MKRKKREILLMGTAIFMVIIFLGNILVKWREKSEVFNTVEAKVVKITFDNTKEPLRESGDSYNRWQEIILRITEGEHSGEVLMMRHTIELSSPYRIKLEKGQKILVSLSVENGKIKNVHLFDVSREKAVFFAVLLFFFALVIVGGLQGIKAIITLLLTAMMILCVLIPKILDGWNPLLTTILVCTFIITITLCIIGGFNKKTLSAIIGTSLGVVIAGVFALFIGELARISGVSYDDAHKLSYLIGLDNSLDFRGVFFSSILIGALGAVMDVSMSISSAMWEIKSIKKDIKNIELFKSGMNIGKDILGSMSNTLILAYTGGAMYLMLIFYASKTGIREVINLELVSSEILRAIVGSMGLTFTIPITAGVFIFVPKIIAPFKRKNR